MLTFKDSRGREWPLDFSFGNLLRIEKGKDGLAFNLKDDPTEVSKMLLADPGEFYKCLWLMIEPEAEKQGVTSEDFSRAFLDVYLEVQPLFFAEWQAFFQKTGRAAVALALGKVFDLYQRTISKATAKVEATLSDGFDRKVEAKINEQLQKSYGALEASLESILAPSPTES